MSSVGRDVSADDSHFEGGLTGAVGRSKSLTSAAKICPMRYWLTHISAIMILTIAGAIMAGATLYQMAAYIALPVDLLSFAESPFVNDIIKLRLALPIYTSPEDNNSYPYTPGTQIITYLIADALGWGKSIPAYRVIQFSYVIAAAAVATAVCDLLARRLLATEEYPFRFLWMSVWFPFLLLVAVDPKFNLYNHSLHNDGLALLVSVCAFWLIVKHARAPRPWLLVGMSLLPGLGFMVKQSLLIWSGIFLVYLVLARNVSWRYTLLYLLGSITVAITTVGVCYLMWGDLFFYWAFNALGAKQVSLLRSVLNLFQAGIYGSMGLVAGWLLVLPGTATAGAALWTSWFLLFSIEAYTSGIGFQANHLGPGSVIATCWFFVALLKVWPKPVRSRWRYAAARVTAVSMVILMFGALGLVRPPRNPVPKDFFRYVAEIEGEFQGFAADKVLLDTGSWIYLRENIVMKDRSAAVSIHVGSNQPQINHAALAATVKRIEDKSYDKILARQLDTDQSWYDFQDRGSGVKAAILANYQPVRRVAAVQGIETWWPNHLLAEVVVLVPKYNNKSDSVSP